MILYVDVKINKLCKMQIRSRVLELQCLARLLSQQTPVKALLQFLLPQQTPMKAPLLHCVISSHVLKLQTAISTITSVSNQSEWRTATIAGVCVLVVVALVSITACVIFGRRKNREPEPNSNRDTSTGSVE